MALTAYGTSPSINEAEWAMLHRIADKGGWHEVVDALTDYAVTPGGGTRQVTVASGDMVVNGVLVRNSAPVTITVNANTGTNPRITTVCLQVDWTGAVDTAASIVAVNGANAASPQPPSLSRTAGTLWQVALARVTVAPGATSFGVSAIDACVPLRRQNYVYKSALATPVLHANDPETQLARIPISDPGWPYRIFMSGYCGFSDVPTGKVTVRGLLDDVPLTSGLGGAQNASDAILRPEWSVNRSGSVVAKMTALPGSIGAGTTTPTGSSNGFTVVVIPD